MSDALADLYVALRAETAPMLEGFARTGTAAEEMAVEVQTVAARLAEQFGVAGAEADKLAAQVAAAGVKMAEEFRGGVDACTAEVEKLVAAEREAAGIIDATAEEIAAAQAKLVQSFGEGATAAERSASMSAEAFSAMRDKIVADLEAVEAAEVKAAEANEVFAAKMSGTSAEMGTAAVAAGTFKAGLSDAAGVVGMTSGQLMTLGAGAAVVAGASVKMAGDFQASTSRLVASAGETKANLDGVRDGILNLAGQVGYSSEQLTDAMYKIESGGQHGADGLKVLQAAAQGAKTENADLKTVADAVGTALIDYHLKASDAADVTSKMVAATSAGKMSFEELAGSLSSVAPIASAAHISLDDMLGTLASMTQHGISAQQATQNMSDAIRHLQNPTSIMRTEMASFGISADDVAAKLGERGLSGTLAYLQQAVAKAMPPGTDKVILDLKNAVSQSTPAVQQLAQKVMDGSMSLKDFTKAAKDLDPIQAKQAQSFATLAGQTHQLGSANMSGAQAVQTYGSAMAKMTGDATGLKVALMTTGENAGNTANAIKSVAGASADAQGNVKGWDEIQGNFNTKIAQAKDGLGALAIKIGTALLPVLTPLVGAIADVVHWMTEHQAVVYVLVGVLGGILVGTLVAVAAAVWSVIDAFVVAAAPIAAVVAVIVAVAAAIIANWSSISGFFVGLWNTVKNAFSDGVNWAGQKLGELGGWFASLPGKAGSALSSLGSTIADKAKQAGTTLIKPFQDGWNAVVAFFSQSPQQIGRELGRVAGSIVKAGINWMVSLKNGVVNGWNSAVAWFTGLPDRISHFFEVLIPLLKLKGLMMLLQLEVGAQQAWANVSAWFTSLPGKILQFFADAGMWLLSVGMDLLHGAKTGAENGWTAVSDFLTSLPGKIVAFFVAAPMWLVNAGGDLIQGFWNGVTNAWNSFWSWVGGVITGFIQGFKEGLGIASPSTIFLQIGTDLIQGLWNGVKQIWEMFVTGVQIEIQFLKDLWNGAPQWLYQAGVDLLNGLWNGIMSIAGDIWNRLISWAQSLWGAVKGVFGIQSPSTVAHETGMHLMQGLANGITAGATIAEASALTAAKKVADASKFTTAQRQAILTSAQVAGGDGVSLAGPNGLGVGARPVLTGVGVGGGQPVTVIQQTFHIQGSVLAEKQLLDVVHNSTAQFTSRNGYSGNPFATGNVFGR